MSNKKKVLLFLGAVMLIAFGNYTQFMKNNKGKTAVEGKNSEKATSSSGNNANQNVQNNEVMAEVKSVPQSQLQPVPSEQTQNKSNTDTNQNMATEGKNSERATLSTGNDVKKKENPKNQKQAAKPEQKQKDAGKLKIETNKNVENQYKLNNPKSEKKKSATEDKSSESTSSSSETN